MTIPTAASAASAARTAVLVEGESDRIALQALDPDVLRALGFFACVDDRERVLRRFLGSQSGRKARYDALLVDALPLDRAPEPMLALLAHVLHPDAPARA